MKIGFYNRVQFYHPHGDPIKLSHGIHGYFPWNFPMNHCHILISHGKCHRMMTPPNQKQDLRSKYGTSVAQCVKPGIDHKGRGHKKLWKDPPFFAGKIHYFDWAIFNSYVTNYQRVTKLKKCGLGFMLCSLCSYIIMISCFKVRCVGCRGERL